MQVGAAVKDESPPAMGCLPAGSSGGSDGEIMCIRCGEPTTIATSQSYGKNPFNRSCNCCCGVYRGEQRLIKREKDASADKKTSVQEQRWKDMEPVEQRMWYKKQKRSVELEDGRRSNLSAANFHVTTAEEQVSDSKKGLLRFNDLVPYGIFYRDQRLLGKDQVTIEEEWRNMLQDGNVDREEVDIQGKKEMCLETFGGIRKYHDVSDTHRVRATLKRQASDSAKLAVQAKDLAEKHKAATEEHKLTGAQILMPKMTNEELQDLTVPDHLLPEMKPFNEVDDLAATPFVQGLLSDMKASEKTEAERESEWHAEAAAWKARTQTRKKKVKEEVGNADLKDVIMFRGVIDRAIAEVKSKQKVLVEGMETSIKDIEREELEADGISEKALKEAMNKSDVLHASVVKKLTEIREFCVENESSIAKPLFKAKKETMLIAKSEFTAEQSDYQAARVVMLTQKKNIDKAIKEKSRQTKKPGVVTTSAGTWVPTCFAAKSMLQGQMENTSQLKDAAGFGKEPVVFQPGEDDVLIPFVQKLESTTYFKQQTKFLDDHLKKSGAGSSQAVAITLKSCLREIAAMLDGCHVPPAIIAKPADIKKKSWSAVFSYQIRLFQKHQFVGVTSFCAGEVVFGIQGQIKIVAIAVDKLEGTLKDQVNKIKGLSLTELTEYGDMMWSFSRDAGEDCKCDSFCIVPPGHLVAVVSNKGLCLSWSFGAVVDEQISLINEQVEKFFEMYPLLNAGEYADWKNWLDAKTAD